MGNRIVFNGLILLDIFKMKAKYNFNFWEWGIIVLGFILLVIPEILYSCILRVRDWVVDRVMEL